ncbi:MAG: T9SS type A sorting domain-containing protein [candidate division Zixibacteria bacterium]|nr:T9SS type A sorting domain-containing protein [candidate division Zixibacteria bacterium]
MDWVSYRRAGLFFGIILWAVFFLFIGLKPLQAAKSFDEYYRELLQTNNSQYLKERLKRSVMPQPHAGDRASGFQDYLYSSSWFLADFKVNGDNFAATYHQTNPRVAMQADNSFVVVWEDARNGDIDIFARKYSSGGTPLTSNVMINQKISPYDQLLPDIGVAQNGDMIISWVDVQNFEIYARRFNSSLATIGPEFIVNDGPANTAWRPSVAVAPSGDFTVVWEDIRSGYNIYGQFYDPSANPQGGNFQINTDIGALPHFSPRAKYDGAKNLIVTWEDYRDGDGDIYFQLYDTSGAAAGPNILASSDVGSEDQYLPDVNRSFDGRFVVTFVDTRNGHPDIYMRRFNNSGIAQGILTLVNSDTGANQQWDPCVGVDSLGKFVISWADYRVLPAIYKQSFDSLGSLIGGNVQLSTPAITRERNSPSIDRGRQSAYVVGWQDLRSGNFDIVGQMVADADTLIGVNFKVNSDLLGAFQTNPAVATASNGNFFVTWEDYRSGAADIYFRAFSQNGSPLNSDTKVNSDTFLTDQVSPDIAIDQTGNICISWLDLGAGSRIMSQFYNSILNPSSLNIEVSDDTGSVAHSRPSCAAMATGRFMLAWSDNRDGSANQHVYGQLFSSPATKSGANFKINDDPAATDHLNPRVAADSFSQFTFVWSDSRSGIPRIYHRLYDNSGAPVDTSQQVSSDSSGTSQSLPDVAVTRQNTKVFTWLENRLTGTNVFAQRYDSSNNPLGPNLAIADPSLGTPNHPRVSVDRNDAFLIAWEDDRNGDPDVYGQFYYASSDSAGEDFKVNSDAGANLQASPDLSLTQNDACLVWVDNRTAGNGLDVYAKKVSYLGVDVKNPPVQISNLPKQFGLHQNYPNPFNRQTTIRYELKSDLPGTGGLIPVILKIYNIKGELVATLLEGNQPPGIYQIVWDGQNQNGDAVGSGVYFYRLQSGDQIQSRKMTLLK